MGRGRRVHQHNRLVGGDGLTDLLALLGVGEGAVTEAPPVAERRQVNIDLFASERSMLDHAAIQAGISKRNGAKLARAIVRSWLANYAAWPAAIGSHPDEMPEASWWAGRAGAAETIAAQLERLTPEDLEAVLAAGFEQLDVEARRRLAKLLLDG